jgi:hypothetical protein
MYAGSVLFVLKMKEKRVFPLQIEINALPLHEILKVIPTKQGKP